MSPFVYESDVTLPQPVVDAWPNVSVIVPAYNAETYLREALESILVQTVPAHEIIVVNDGSTDGTGALADEYARVHPQVRVIHQENGGPAAARNAAIAAAAGEFLTFLDADDAMAASRIESQVGYLLTHPETDIVIGSVERISEVEVGLHTEFLRQEQIAEERARGINLMVMTARASVFAMLGTFDPSYRLSEDWEWLVRAHAREVTVAFVPRREGRRRLHGKNVSSAVEDVRHQMLRVLRERIRGQRGEGEPPDDR